MSKRLAVLVTAAMGSILYAGCSAPAETPGEDPKVGSTAEAYSYNCTTPDPNGATEAWLLAADCSCPYTSPDPRYIECWYEKGALACLQASGFRGSCGFLPRLPVIEALNPTTKQLSYYDAIDPQVYFPNDCAKATAVAACLTNLNNTINPFTFTHPYLVPPVSARILPHCTPTACEQSGGVGPDVGIFDPCTTSSCHQ